MSFVLGLHRFFLLLLILPCLLYGMGRDFYDRRHYSPTFGQWRDYRIILPPDYATSGKHYPVIYYFHGHSGRYKGEQYGNGQIFLPEMVDFVRKHDVIVVKWDGYVDEDYYGFYGGTPYDIQNKGFGMDFGLYFLDLVAHVDSTYRTLDDRQHRATSGLSMGGFMSLYVSGRFPDLVGSASAFDPAHENHAGPEGMKVLRKHSNHVLNHGHSKIRLVKSSGDYLGQHHDLLSDVYARTPEVDFEFRQDEYHRHWVTSIEETFKFHMKAFEDSGLNAHPKSWSYDNAYPEFAVWGYQFQVKNKKAGFVCLRNVTRDHFRIFTRQYCPDGPSVRDQVINLTTPAYYGSSKTYRIMDYAHADGEVSYYSVKSTPEGRLKFTLDGPGHDLAILTGKEKRAPVLLPVSRKDRPVVETDTEIHLPVKLLNTSDVASRNVRVNLTSEYPTVDITGGEITIDSIGPGQVVDLTGRITQRFTSSDGALHHCRLNLVVNSSGYYSSAANRIDVWVLPTPLTEPAEVIILDGKTHVFKIFRQAGNQGGGYMVDREVTEGEGDGDGIAEPGEEVTLWVRTVQGLDPFDKHSWHRTKVFTRDPCITESRDFAEQKGLEWTSVRDHTSAIRISSDCPKGRKIKLGLGNESYSFHWTPDARYGERLLRQAIQLHRAHVHGYTLSVGE